MKKTALFSLAAAAALTFGAASTNAKAATIQQPVPYENVMYTSLFQWNLDNQTDLNKLFNSLLNNATGVYSFPASFGVPAGFISQPTVVKPVQPVQSTMKPVQPAAKPVQSTTKPVQPAAKPVQSTMKPVQPAAKPVQSTTKPIQPTTKPAQPTTQPTQSTAKPASAPATSALSAYEQQVIALTNQERAKQGLSALKVDTTLSKVAQVKSQDMYNANYFSHTSPTYGSPFDMMTHFGISYRSAGENIAMGQKTPEEVVQAWMNSPGHRANILNNTYTYIGVGYVSGKNIWTQEFISK